VLQVANDSRRRGTRVLFPTSLLSMESGRYLNASLSLLIVVAMKLKTRCFMGRTWGPYLDMVPFPPSRPRSELVLGGSFIL
jgi:hypothetical protein